MKEKPNKRADGNHLELTAFIKDIEYRLKLKPRRAATREFTVISLIRFVLNRSVILNVMKITDEDKMLRNR